MSYSDSDSSSGAGDHHYKNFKQISRERLLHEMLRSAKVKDSKSTWKVLIMDKLTVKVMSYSCKMGDITAEGVSLVEDIYRRRQPLPSMDAIYFIQPTKENVIMFLSDMAGRTPLYRKYVKDLLRNTLHEGLNLQNSKHMTASDIYFLLSGMWERAFVYFSSPISRELVAHIKKDSTVLPRIGALSEMNLEYFAIDSQGFITDNGKALENLFGDEENTRKADACLNVMANRIATVFASLREFPFVRYRAAKSLDPMTMTTFRDLIPTKLAAGIWNCLVKCKSIPNFPQQETCELLVLDRSIDQIAPVIHEWTYDAMCHDLLNMEGNKYVHEVPSKTGGPPEKKEVLLEEHDPIWLELRHAHIGDANLRLHEKMTNFVSKNKAAQHQQGSRDVGEISTRDLQKMVQALPQYSEQIEKLSLHVEVCMFYHDGALSFCGMIRSYPFYSCLRAADICHMKQMLMIAGKINQIITEQGLKELGQLEQDLVFGDAGMKDVIKFLTTNEAVSHENKLRLMMILAAIYPEKFEGEKGLSLMKLAKLSTEDANAVNNMSLLAPLSESKKGSASSFSLKFDIHKKKRAARKDRCSEQETWQLSRFYPIIEVCLDIAAASIHEAPVAHSMRSRRTPTWARPRGSDDGYSSDSVLRHTSSDLKKRGKRIFVFIAGGATRSELRVCHKLTGKLNREVVLGSTSIDDPQQFITKLKQLTPSEISLDDLQI
ncbi:SNARE-interacting protein KEULE [Gossypium australe]|uniref:SNARE-interacting protein KEULE n=1 Tax=Gossypium australe TaxID=47621 RepID=A0A5B6VJ30_9ROSI|nr:SNARE-interacting protein KEULE [Gossypium australe]